MDEELDLLIEQVEKYYKTEDMRNFLWFVYIKFKELFAALEYNRKMFDQHIDDSLKMKNIKAARKNNPVVDKAWKNFEMSYKLATGNDL